MDSDEESDDGEYVKAPDSKRQRLGIIGTPFVRRPCPATFTGQALCISPDILKAAVKGNELSASKAVKDTITELERSQAFRAPERSKDIREVPGGRSTVDVAEVYSPPRVTETAAKMGLKA